MTLSKEKVSLLLLSALFISFGFGVTTMDMDENGNMTDCPFMDAGAICQMGLFEHIEAVQRAFMGIPAKSITLAALLLSFVVSLSIVPKINSPPGRLEFFTKEVFPLPHPSKLLLALSDGIIQPKLYA